MKFERMACFASLVVGIAIPTVLSSGLATAANDCSSSPTAPCWSDSGMIGAHAALNLPPPWAPPGDYLFSIDRVLACKISSDPGESLADLQFVPSDCDFSASGSVHNVVCGTGTVDATFAIHENPGPNQDTYSGSIAGMQFIAGQAVPFVAPITESDSTSATLIGSVNAVPDPPIPGDGFCTHGFTFVVTGQIIEPGD